MNHYFYIDNDGKQKGTFTPDELKNENIKKDTLVWTQGMEQWKRAAEVPELNYLFEIVTPGASSTYTETSQQPPIVQQPVAPNLGQQPSMKPKNWLVESILVTILPFIFCGSLLSLLGIIGIVNGSQVDSLYSRGEYDAALNASNQARRWTKITLWITIGWIALWIILFILLIVLAGSASGFGEMFENYSYEM